MQGPLGKEFTRFSTRSSHKDLRKIMQATCSGCQQDLLEDGCQQDLLEDASRIFTRSPDKDLYKIMQRHPRISSGSAQHLLTRASIRPRSRSLYRTIFMHHETLAIAS